MINIYVIDASIYASIAVKDKFYIKSRSLLLNSRKKGCVTLDLALIEAYNALWKHVYLLKRIPIDDYIIIADTLADIFEKSVTKIYNIVNILDDALKTAVNYGITVYDSAYLVLAEKLGYKLITFDKELEKKLKNTDYEEIIYIPEK